MDNFSLYQIAEIIGVPQPTLHMAVRRWKLEPSLKGGRRGAKKTFSRRDAFACIVAFLLHRQSISVETIRKAIRFCREADIERRLDNGERFLVANNKQLFLAREDAIFLNRENAPAAAVVMDLSRVLQLFQRRLALPELDLLEELEATSAKEEVKA